MRICKIHSKRTVNFRVLLKKLNRFQVDVPSFFCRIYTKHIEMEKTRK